MTYTISSCDRRPASKSARGSGEPSLRLRFTLLALALVLISRHSESNSLSMIVVLGLLAIAFSTQLLPMTVDMLYLQWARARRYRGRRCRPRRYFHTQSIFPNDFWPERARTHCPYEAEY